MFSTFTHYFNISLDAVRALKLNFLVQNCIVDVDVLISRKNPRTAFIAYVLRYSEPSTEEALKMPGMNEHETSPVNAFARIHPGN